jgi:hypothetical protein
MPSFLASPRALLGNIAYYIALYMVFVITCAFIVITVNDIVSFFHFAMDSRELGRQVVVLCLGPFLVSSSDSSLAACCYTRSQERCSRF